MAATGQPCAGRALEVRLEVEQDAGAVRVVHEHAFGRPNEARVVELLRAEARPYLGLVAVEAGQVMGHIAFSPATLESDGASTAIMALGPMAVHPDRQRRGLGSALVREGLAACRRMGHAVVAVLGHPEFYPRFGFVPAAPLGVTCEYPAAEVAFMIAELTAGSLKGRRGTVYYDPAFRLAG